MEIDAYDPEVFSRYHCATGAGAAAETLRYIQSVTRFTEKNVIDILLKLYRAPTSSNIETQIMQHIAEHYVGQSSLVSVIRATVHRRIAEEWGIYRDG